MSDSLQLGKRDTECIIRFHIEQMLGLSMIGNRPVQSVGEYSIRALFLTQFW